MRWPLAKGFGNTMPYGFLESLRDDIRNGALPEVSWIIPPSVYSEHPGPSAAQGGWYVQAVLDALTANPEVWSKTVLLVNYDENDGFFDHMPSPAVPSRNADGTLAGGHTLRDADVAAEYHDFTPATSSQPATDGRPYGPRACRCGSCRRGAAAAGSTRRCSTIRRRCASSNSASASRSRRSARIAARCAAT